MKSAVIYEGPSRIDGSPIVAIVCKMQSAGKANRKTGDMVQTYILRADVDPVAAVKTGADVSICGDCGHRGAWDADQGRMVGRTCYVNLGQGALSVFRAYQRGAYPRVTPREASRIIAGRMVRLGTYGDPAAVPATVWRALLRFAAGHTGYTHQWRQRFAESLKGLCMASVETPGEAFRARAKGWRTFRIAAAAAPNVGREALCPASEEAGQILQCADCKACDGASGRRSSIRIAPHGAYASAANLARLNARLIARG